MVQSLHNSRTPYQRTSTATHHKILLHLKNHIIIHTNEIFELINIMVATTTAHQIAPPEKSLFMNSKTSQFVCFLSGAGGTTGKSEVINTVRYYCKLFYNELGIEFTKRTIVITAITGSAAVSIHGETMHFSCDFNSKMSPDEDWKNTIMVVVDEISFIKRCDFEKLNTILNTKCEVSSPRRFGNLQMIFAGNFCQLKPSNNFSHPLYIHTRIWVCGMKESMHSWN